jgi:MFS family permease
MSNYPSPYTPPGPQLPMNFDYYQPQGDVMGPARQAGFLLFLLAGLTLVCALACGGMGALFPRLIDQHPEVFEKLQRIPDATPGLIRTVFFVAAGVMLVMGAAQVVLGIYVRRASKAAIIVALILAIITIGWIALNALGSLSTDPSSIVGICIMAIPLSLYVLLVVWLIAALKSASAVQTARDQYAAQYWQHAYQQQMYQQQTGAYPPQPPQEPPPTSSRT